MSEPLSNFAFNFNLRRYVKELQSALRLRDGEARRSVVQMSTDHAAESEALRTELAALRDRLRYAGAAYAQRIGGDSGGGKNEDDAEARVAVETDG